MTTPSLHLLNIGLHAGAGALAILIGAAQLALTKGDAGHRRRGQAALAIMSLSVAAAMAGAILFKGVMDLLGVSALVAYQLYSATRALRLRKGGRLIQDVAPAFLVFGSGGALVALNDLGAPMAWSAPKVLATAFGLVVYGGYDVVRTYFPAALRPRIAPSEHAFKMTSLVFAFVSVGVTTLLHDQGPVIPLSISAVGMAVSIAAAVRIWPRFARNTDGETP